MSDINLQPGDNFIVHSLDGTEHADIVHSIRSRDAQPEVRQRTTGWRRILRNVTPPRWRKPLPILRPYQPGGIKVIGMSEKSRRAVRVAEDMQATLSRLLDRKS